MAEPSGRVVVVTGATGPLGEAVCRLLDQRGAIVLAVGRDAAGLDPIAATERYVCDLADASAVAAMAEEIEVAFGFVDGLIHLVGGWRPGHSQEDFDWLEERLLTTLRNATIAFHGDLDSSSSGRLAIVSSTGVDRPTWSNANYATLKTAAEAWVNSIASGWRKNGRAAAVTFVVTSISDTADHTSAEDIAEHLAAIWELNASRLNGERILLTPDPARMAQ
jgi:NAD(P)-dependent dehydrogenase (short-subunit alcohol dehydrogenase family)